MTSPRHLALAVDCGSTSFKAALFSASLERLGEGSVSVPYAVREGAVVELSAEALWTTFLDLAAETCASAGVSAQAVDTIAFDSQAQTFAFCAPTGLALTPFYSWMDCRASAEAAELDARLGHGFHRHCSFAPPIPPLQLSKMLWVSRHAAAAIGTAGRLVMLPGFLAERLGVPNTTDRNLAAMGGAYSLVSGGWWPAALAVCGLAADRLPRLVDVGATVQASVAPYSDLFRPDVAVTFAGNDQTAGAYGNACERGGMVVTLGTALVVYRHAGAGPGPYNSGGCWGPYPGGSYYELGTLDQGCQALDWARHHLMPGTPPDAFDAAVQRVVDEHRESSAPFFQPGRIATGTPWTGAPIGTPAPGGRGGSAGHAPPWSFALQGTAPGGRAEDTALAAYAVLEGISFALRRLLEINLGAAGQIHEIAVIGGGGKSTVWLSLLASVLGTPVTRGTGDALLGAAALSVGAPVTVIQPERTVYSPDRARAAILEARYRRWSDVP
jgi:xylulokinase